MLLGANLEDDIANENNDEGLYVVIEYEDGHQNDDVDHIDKLHYADGSLSHYEPYESDDADAHIMNILKSWVHEYNGYHDDKQGSNSRKLSFETKIPEYSSF